MKDNDNSIIQKRLHLIPAISILFAMHIVGRTGMQGAQPVGARTYELSFVAADPPAGGGASAPAPATLQGGIEARPILIQRSIARISWAPKETILRRAKGADNWPMTWGDDDALYTAYGDGNGFEPFVPEKLSLGLAKVTGSPPLFEGVNLSAPTLESKGDGSAGHKASGLLMIDGVLYLLARNVNNAQLAWSRDHGATWTWAGWKFTESFGAPTFINFGRDNSGARDGFAYVVSHDSNTAYEVADAFVLARAPRERLHERAAWEFFAGAKSEEPVWTHEAARRAPVLRALGKCYRAGISYDAPLQRYLLVHPAPAKKSRDGDGKIDTRFAGGLAIYEAAEPWGPWRSVYQTENWDVGPGETASFPPKWMSADGKTLHLVFSGDDCFSVRQAALVLEGDR